MWKLPRRNCVPLHWQQSLIHCTAGKSLPGFQVLKYSPHCTLAWRTPCTEEPGGLSSVGVTKSRTRLSDWTHKRAGFSPPAFMPQFVTQSHFCGNRSLKVSPARVSIPFIKPNSNFPVLTLVIRFPNGERKLDVQPSLCLLQIVLLLEVLLYLHSGSCLTGVRFPLHCSWLIDTKASCSHHDWRRLEQLNQLGSRPGEK